jgi:hypothetical protein
MTMHLGDFADNQTIHFHWSTNAADGASITRSTNGTISVYKNDSATQTTTGVTDTEDFDSLTGVHLCKIVTTDAFYETGKDYTVILSGATIDGESVNAVLAHFSIQNRYFPSPVNIGISGTALTNLENDYDGTGYAKTASSIGTATAVTGEVAANVTKVGGSSTRGTKLSYLLDAATYGAAVAGTLSATQMTTNLTETTNDHYVGKTIAWLTGALAGQGGKLVTDYVGSSKMLTYEATTEAPAAGDVFILL